MATKKRETVGGDVFPPEVFQPRTPRGKEAGPTARSARRRRDFIESYLTDEEGESKGRYPGTMSFGPPPTWSPMMGFLMEIGSMLTGSKVHEWARERRQEQKKEKRNADE